MKDYFGYQEKVVIVTGASSGMGKATAEILVDLGAKVYALDWNACDVKGIEKFVQVDLSKKDSINQAMKELPKHVDSFFGIAGVSGMKNDFMTTVSIDFIANKYICEEYLIHSMTENGTIAFMTSTGGNGWEKEENKKYYLDAIASVGWDATVESILKTGFQYLPGTLGYPFAKLAHGEEGLLSHCGYANRLAYSKEMAGPIVFLNSQMASYASGVLMEVDYGNTIEERASIKPIQQAISLEAIHQMMQQQSDK